MDDITYTSYEAAQLLGVNEATIRRRCADGRIAGATRRVVRKREIWMIPLSALGEGAGDVLQPVPEGLEGDQLADPL